MNLSRPRASATVCQLLHGGAHAHLSVVDGTPCLHTALPNLSGDPAEVLLESSKASERTGAWHLFSHEEFRAGIAVAPEGMDLERATTQLYEQLLESTRDLHLYRVWNYVPQINQYTDELENYAHFCRGRSLSFENAFGTDFKSRLPAASAVGAPRGPLAVAFLAGIVPPQHFENPRQVPAFEYPSQYGPRPPSFARATAVTAGGRQHIYISGTAAIRGHQTVAPNDLPAQLQCMVENFSTIADTAGAGAARDWTRSFKVYVRHAADLSAVAEHLRTTLLRSGDQVHYLQADICRAPLLVEIEAVLTAAT